MALKKILHYDVSLDRNGWDLWMTVEGLPDTVHWSGEVTGGLADILAVITDPRVRYHTEQGHLSLNTHLIEPLHEDPA